MRDRALRVATALLGCWLLASAIARILQRAWIYPTLLGRQWSPLEAVAGGLLVGVSLIGPRAVSRRSRIGASRRSA